MSYIVKAHHWQSQEKVFEGPLDLLLELIEKEKLNITDVSLAQVTGQFLEYIQESEKISLEHMADFLLVAGKLILIKSRAILPLLALEKEEEEDIEELKARLAEYKKFREISKELKKLEERRKILFSRENYSGLKAVFCPPENISALDLQSAFESVVEKMPKLEIITRETIREVISIKDKIEHLKRNLAQRIEITFLEATISVKTKLEVIVTFLAMLELAKNNTVIIKQSEMFGEIKIRKIF